MLTCEWAFWISVLFDLKNVTFIIGTRNTFYVNLMYLKVWANKVYNIKSSSCLKNYLKIIRIIEIWISQLFEIMKPTLKSAIINTQMLFMLGNLILLKCLSLLFFTSSRLFFFKTNIVVLMNFYFVIIMNCS